MLNHAYVLQHLPLLLYAALLASVVFLPLRWSLIAFLLLSTVDMESSNVGIGPLNFAKGLLLPLYLLFRLRGRTPGQSLNTGAVAWIGLTVYVGIASAWSLFPIASLKLIGHMAGALLIAVVWVKASQAHEIKPGAVVPVTLGIVALGSLRSIFLPHYNDEATRFTSFTAAQSFAALVAALYCLALCSRELRPVIRTGTCLALASVLLFNGSRIWFAGILAATVIEFLLAEIPTWVKTCAVGAAIIISAMAAFQVDVLMRELSAGAGSNRIASAITAFYTGDTSSAGLGTINFRRRIDSLALERIEKSSILDLIFGHGTCNGAVITGSLFKAYAAYSDPNRMFHNEWLRTFYEWGLIGFTLWGVFIVSVVRFAAHAVRGENPVAARPLFAYLPGFLVALGAENLLAGAGNSVSMGFLLLLGMAGAERYRVTHWISAHEEIPVEALPELAAAATVNRR